MHDAVHIFLLTRIRRGGLTLSAACTQQKWSLTMQMSFDFGATLGSMEQAGVSQFQAALLQSVGLSASNRREAMFMIDDFFHGATQKQRAILLDLGFIAPPKMKKTDAAVKIAELLEAKKQRGLSFRETSLLPL
jgi:hypothetical protein